MSVYAYEPKPERHGFAALFRQLVDDIRDLIQQHIELTKAELRQGGIRLSKSAVLGVAGLLLAQVSLIYLASILMLLMISLTPLRVLGATLVTCLIFLIAAAVCFGLIYREIKQMRHDLAPPKS